MLTIPGRIPWDVHRVATSGVYHDPLHTILTAWSLGDLLDAHDVLDAFAAAQES